MRERYNENDLALAYDLGFEDANLPRRRNPSSISIHLLCVVLAIWLIIGFVVLGLWSFYQSKLIVLLWADMAGMFLIFELAVRLKNYGRRK